MVNMASDSHRFKMHKDLERLGWKQKGDRFAKGGKEMIPLYEAKMVNLWNSRFATYHHADEDALRKGHCRDADVGELRDPGWRPLPRYWVPRDFADNLWEQVGWKRGWTIVFRDIARATDERTSIAAFAPAVAFGHPTPVLITEASAPDAALLVANLSCLPFDYCVRGKVSGTHMSFFVLYQLPVFSREFYNRWRLDGQPLHRAVSAIALRLSCTSEAMRPLAREAGHTPEVTPWDEDRRFAEMRLIDGIFARLYGLTRDDLAYVLDTFPIVRQNDLERYGEFRTKTEALRAYDDLEGRLTSIKGRA